MSSTSETHSEPQAADVVVEHPALDPKIEESATGQENGTIESNYDPPVNGIHLEKRPLEVPVISTSPVDIAVPTPSLPNESFSKVIPNELLETQDTEEPIHRPGELEEESEHITEDSKVEILVPATENMAAEDLVDSLAGSEEQEKESQLLSCSDAEPQDEILKSAHSPQHDGSSTSNVADVSISVEQNFPVIDDGREAELEVSPESTTAPEVVAVEDAKESNIPIVEDTEDEHSAQTQTVTQSANIPESTLQASTADEIAPIEGHELNEDAKESNILLVEDMEDEQTKDNVSTVTQSAGQPEATLQASTADEADLTREHESNEETLEKSVQEVQETTEPEAVGIPMDASLEQSLDGTGASMILGQGSSDSVPDGMSGDAVISQDSTENVSTTVFHTETEALPLQEAGQEEELSCEDTIRNAENAAKNESRNESTATIDQEAECTIPLDTATEYKVENSAQERSTDPGPIEASIHGEPGMATEASVEIKELSLMGEEVEEPVLHNPPPPDAVAMNEFQTGESVEQQYTIEGPSGTQEIMQEDVIGRDDHLHDVVPKRDAEAIQGFLLEDILVQDEALKHDEGKVEPLVVSAEKPTGVTAEYITHMDERLGLDVFATPSLEEGENPYGQELSILAALDNSVPVAGLEQEVEASSIKEYGTIESSGITKDIPPTSTQEKDQIESEAFSIVDYVSRTEVGVNVDDQALSTTLAQGESKMDTGEAPEAVTETGEAQESAFVKAQVIPESDIAPHDNDSVSETPLVIEPTEQTGSIEGGVELAVEQVEAMELASTETLEAAEQVMYPHRFVYLLEFRLTCNTRSLPTQES